MDITNKFDVSNYPEPQKSTVIAALSEIVLIKLASQLYEELSEGDKAHLGQLNDEPTALQSQQMWDFFRSNYPDIEKRVQQLINSEQASLEARLATFIELIKKEEPAS